MPHHRSLPVRISRCLVLGLGTLLGLVACMLLVFRFVNPPTTAFMIGHQLSDSRQAVRQQWVPLADMSPWLPLAVVASEDQRFPHHWGLDFDAIGSALEEFRGGGGLRGASTITQQTAKNLFLWSGRSFPRKALEAGIALGLELTWSKARIMEVYLNVAEFGEGIYGVEAASQAFFGTGARHLGPRRAAQLAAVLPNPKVFNAGNPSPYVRQRVAWIRGQMVQLSGLSYLEGRL